jgi:hypothetical protein
MDYGSLASRFIRIVPLNTTGFSAGSMITCACAIPKAQSEMKRDTGTLIDSWIEFRKQEYFNNSGRSLNLLRIPCSPWEMNIKLLQVLDDLSRSRTGAL